MTLNGTGSYILAKSRMFAPSATGNLLGEMPWRDTAKEQVAAPGEDQAWPALARKITRPVVQMTLPCLVFCTMPMRAAIWRTMSGDARCLASRLNTFPDSQAWTAMPRIPTHIPRLDSDQVAYILPTSTVVLQVLILHPPFPTTTPLTRASPRCL